MRAMPLPVPTGRGRKSSAQAHHVALLRLSCGDWFQPTAMLNLKTLQGMLPICAHCKKVRDDQGYWTQIEHYVRTHSEAEFTHGICPECIKEHYGEVEMVE